MGDTVKVARLWPRSLRVDIAVGGRFHAFDLARELDRRAALETLYTGYPRFLVSRFGPPSLRVQSVWWHECVTRLLDHVKQPGYRRRSSKLFLNNCFDKAVARRLRFGATHFVGWSGMAEHSLIRAKKMGMITIVERCSTHIRWQRKILQEEQSMFNVFVEIPDLGTVEKEIREYAIADYISVPTRFVARTFVSEGVSDSKLLINPYGVDLTRFACGANRECDGVMEVLHVGRASIRKGVPYLVEAMNSLNDARLTVVGHVDDEVKKFLKRSHITAVGAVPGWRLPEYYHRAHVFCLLSLEEGMAYVLTQAMASGLPVIATANTGVEELITHGVEGFVVPIRSPADVAIYLRYLRDHPIERIAMGERARKRAENGFGWSDYGRRAYENYERILSA